MSLFGKPNTIEVKGTLTLDTTARDNLWRVNNAPEPKPEPVRPPKPESVDEPCRLRNVRVRIYGSDGKFRWEKHKSSHVQVQGDVLRLTTQVIKSQWYWRSTPGSWLHDTGNDHALDGYWENSPFNKVADEVGYAPGMWVSYMVEEFPDE